MRHSIRSTEGYLQIDHRAGYGTAEVPGGKQMECATATCAHCGAIIVLNPQRTRSRGHCRKCNQYICDGCTGKMWATGECVPLVKVFDTLQESAATGRRVSQGGIILPR